MANDDRVELELPQGRLRGVRDDGVIRFRGVPFALPPLGPRRFQPPEPLPPGTTLFDASAAGPIPPQTPSRLARVLGDYDLPQDEDCLTVNIATPALNDARRPVLVWLYGGAFVTGGNAIPWYDGAGFARRHDIVFVGVNYRIGALGFLTLDGVSPGNLGLRDQVAALEWVQQNIARFGGDPDQVTLAGQSAGAISTFCLLAARQADGLFQRAILQSGRFNAIADAEEARQSGEAMLDRSGLSREAFRELPLDQLLKLQLSEIRANAAFGLTTTPFRPCADGALVATDVWQAATQGGGARDIMLGWTRDEMAAFYAGSADILAGTEDQVEMVFRSQWGETWRDGMAYARARHPGAAQDRFLDLGLNECMFAGSAVALAERLAEVRPAWLYRFDWAADGNPFGACHCIELPFVFDNLSQWQAPMLEGAHPQAMAALGAVIQTAWARFVRDGDPGHDALPAWPRYDADRRWTLRVGGIVETVGDLAGLSLPGRPLPATLPLPR